MNAIVLTVFLALAWTAMTGSLTFQNLALGLLVGLIALMATRRVPGLPSFSRRALRAITLALYVAAQLILSNLRVAADVLRPKSALRPAVLDVPLDARTDTEITLLAALITLTPGTTAIGISRDRRTLYVHFTNLRRHDRGPARQEIRDGFERRLLEVLR